MTSSAGGFTIGQGSVVQGEAGGVDASKAASPMTSSAGGFAFGQAAVQHAPKAASPAKTASSAGGFTFGQGSAVQEKPGGVDASNVADGKLDRPPRRYRKVKPVALYGPPKDTAAAAATPLPGADSTSQVTVKAAHGSDKKAEEEGDSSPESSPLKNQGQRAPTPSEQPESMPSDIGDAPEVLSRAGLGKNPVDRCSGTTTEFEKMTKEHIRPLIELNDQINALTKEERTINSTRIVVAGDQSHGKTSLLEALSGVDLPRGEGVQTRVPLVLQLRESASREEYALIKVSSSGDEPERIALADVAEKVREYTQKAAGGGKDVRDVPLEVKIFRHDQDDLTLVDLPGITRVALSDQAGGDGRRLEELILGMCRRYMEPEQSILLNVVSAMVDFSTSASLQLSRSLDPRGERTMLCVTKVDQHREAGLHDKINAAMEMMELAPEHVFAVRNRSQQENDIALPLEEVRGIEKMDLEVLSRFESPSYGLGVAALSKQLVKIQYEQIVQSLPRARDAIDRQRRDLERKVAQLGEPVGDSRACRSKAMQLIESSVTQLQNEIAGRADVDCKDAGQSLEGRTVEISLPVNILAQFRKGDPNHSVQQKLVSVENFSFQLLVQRNKAGGVGAYVAIVQPFDVPTIKSMIVDVSITAESENTFINEEAMTEDFAERRGKPCGWESFLSEKEAGDAAGCATFHATIFIQKLVTGRNNESSQSQTAAENVLLCAKLNKLQEELVTSIDTLHSNRYFFSGAMRKRLEREVSACRGGVGLPGAIAPHVPVNVLKALRENLPSAIATYRQAVLKACIEKAESVIDSIFDQKLYPKLNGLVKKETMVTFERQATCLEGHHELILEWEDSVCSSNHYFMDIVQEVRKGIGMAEDDKERPTYLRHFSEDKVKAMSNEEQRLIDMQIEIFAYWKLMKKRFIDNILMSTNSALVKKPINCILKPTLLEAVMCNNDEDVVAILSPDAGIVREREKHSSRLERLRKASETLEQHDKLQL